MKYHADIKRFRQNQRHSQFVAGPLAIIFGLVFISLASYRFPLLHETANFSIAPFVFGLFGLLSFLVGMYFLFYTPADVKKILRVYMTGIPTMCEVEFVEEQEIDSNSYSVNIESQKCFWTARVMDCPRSIDSLVGTKITAEVYFEPEADKPLIVRTKENLFFCDSGRQVADK